VLLGVGATAVGLAAGLAGTAGGTAGAALVLVIGWSCTLAARSGPAWDRVLERPFVRGSVALGASRGRADRLALRVVLGPFISGTIPDLPALLTAAFVVEHAFHLKGIGEPTIWALRSGNVTWLLGLALSGALSVGVGQIAADWVHRLLDPRLGPRLMSRSGHLD
jgi:ABC-type dipeptide/oligopeptide/nickel transport system permease component